MIVTGIALLEVFILTGQSIYGGNFLIPNLLKKRNDGFNYIREYDELPEKLCTTIEQDKVKILFL